MAKYATGLNGSPHLVAIIEAAADEIGSFDLSPLLVYMIDTVPSSALPWLAQQFGVLGFRGWDLITTDLERRSLIKTAIEIWRYKGTPYAIKQALKSIGYNNVQIIEGEGFPPEIFTYPPEIPEGSLDQFSFRVVLDLGDSKGVTDAGQVLVERLIKEYKNTRSWYTGATYIANIYEDVAVNDDQFKVTEESGSSDSAAASDGMLFVVKDALGNIVTTENL